MTSSIIHSGLLPLLRNASTTLRRLAAFLRLASLVAVASRCGAPRLDDGVDAREQLLDGLGAHAGDERLGAELLDQLLVALLAEQLALLEARVLRVDDDVASQ
jgi:hypothetical protein